MNFKVLIGYCETQKDKKWQTANALFKTKRYADCLFFCHLTLEFALKTKVVQITQEHFPFTHDLEYLAKKTQLSFSHD